MCRGFFPQPQAYSFTTLRQYGHSLTLWVTSNTDTFQIPYSVINENNLNVTSIFIQKPVAQGPLRPMLYQLLPGQHIAIIHSFIHHLLQASVPFHAQPNLR